MQFQIISEAADVIKVLVKTVIQANGNFFMDDCTFLTI